MPVTSSADSKSRHSSAGKGFFSRRILRDKSSNDQDVPELPSIPSSTTGSQSSRHSHQTSYTSSERPISRGTDAAGLAMQAGVLTSIPYEHTTSDTKQPTNYASLPRPDHGLQTGREPSPHHLNKGHSDYHQYPSIDTSSLSLSDSRPTGPRPLNGPSTASRGSDKGMFSDRWYGPNGSLKQPLPSDSGDSRGHRGSFDQQSVYSNGSPNRASSVLSFPNNSQASFPTSTSEQNITSPPHSSRASQSIFGNHHASALSSSTSFNPSEYSLNKPPDDRIVEQEFLNLMLKRGYQGLPEQARRQMEAYPIAKKWTLVHQDRLSELQNEQQRRAKSRNTAGYDGQSGLLGRADEEGSPEWYVRKLMDSSIALKQLQSLAVSLRTQPIGWVRTFVNAQGQIALSNVLNKLNRRSGQGPASQMNQNEKDSDREYEIVKCLKALMNNEYGADDALEHPQIIVALTTSLTSSRLATRKLVSEVLTFLTQWMEGVSHAKVLQSFDQLKAAQGENGRFDAWMRIVEVSVDGRGKMGSLVGASDEYRSGGTGMENMLMEYAVASLLLVNMLVDAPDRDLQLRCHIRAQLNGCGIQRILTKMEGFQYEVIDKQIERFRNNGAIDYEDMLERDGGSVQDGEDEPERDLNDPLQIVDAISTRTQGSKSYDYFLSAMQHMLLIRDNQGEDQLRMFQLVDSMLSYVATDRRLPDMDLKQSLNFSVQGLLDKLYTDSEARQARDESLESKQIADAAIAERDDMRAKVELGAGGLVAKLQKQLAEQQALIQLQNRKLDTIKSELSESQRLRAQDLQRNELETRELYLMMRDAQEATAAAIKKASPDGVIKDPVQMQGIIDREKLMDRLGMHLERQKTQAKLEGRVWQQVKPSDELRELREQMDGENTPEQKQERLSRQFGSVVRKSMRRQVETPEDSDAGDETIVYETPRLVEYSRPMVDKAVAQNYLNDIVSKVRRFDGSDDEDAEGDGVTTGPSHPSIESEEPKTPEDVSIPQSNAKGFAGPPPPPPPPMPGFSNATPSLMPGFSGAPPPPPPAMPGFSSGGPPPPPPPMPSFLNGPTLPSTPGAPGFTDGPPPPHPSGFVFTGNKVPPSPGIPGAPPLPGTREMYRRSQQDNYQQGTKVALASVRPKKKLKNIHWEKVDAPQVTIWAGHAPSHEAKEEKYLELSRNGILDEVERLFRAKEIKQIGKAVKQADDKKLIIASDLQKTFHIALSKFHNKGIDEVVRMIIHCDKEVIDNDNVMDFLQRGDLCDIPENTAKLMAPYARDYTTSIAADPDQDPEELTRADQIYLHTAFELHHYWKARMRALALTRSFEKDYETISSKMDQVVQVCQSLRDTVSLFNVLGLILDIGNFMNDSSKQASGFKLSTLARLGMVKDDKGESTFADIIERIVRQQYPQWEAFVTDIAGVIPAQKINVEQLRTDAQKYVTNINNVQQSLDSGNLSDPKKFHPQDRVSQIVQRSMKDARWKAEQMTLYLEDMSKTYDDILSFFGEDPTDENSRRDFFSKIAVFLQNWKRSREKNMVLEDQRRRNDESMRRKAAAGGPSAQLTNGSAGIATSPGADREASTGAMDSLLEKLRAAAPQAKDQRDRRRRARLRDRHQVRVASGQAVSDVPETPESPSVPWTADDIEGGPPGVEDPLSPAGDNLTEGKEGEDIADRAASMLQGLGAGSPTADNVVAVRRRRDREGSGEERERRRRRNRGVGSESISAPSPVVEEHEKEREAESLDAPQQSPPLPQSQPDAIPEGSEDGRDVAIRMVVSPPSPRPASSDE